MTELSFRPENSKAVLIGVGKFDYELGKHENGLAAVPIAANFEVMDKVLREKLGIADIERLPNPNNVISEVNKKLNSHRQIDTLFVYFSGHGLYDSRDLYLAAPHSIADNADSGVAFTALFKAVKNKATNTVFILDCCYSANILLPNIKNRPLFLLAAASSKDTAKNSPDKTQPTPFTAAFCKLLEHGSAQGEEFFTLQSVANNLKNKEVSGLEVEPVYVEHSDKGSSLRLCKNPAFKRVSDEVLRAKLTKEIIINISKICNLIHKLYNLRYTFFKLYSISVVLSFLVGVIISFPKIDYPPDISPNSQYTGCFVPIYFNKFSFIECSGFFGSSVVTLFLNLPKITLMLLLLLVVGPFLLLHDIFH